MSVHEDPLDRALRRVSEPHDASADDDARWLARALEAVDASAPDVEGQLLGAHAHAAIDDLLAAPCPDGAVVGEPAPSHDGAEGDAIGEDDPWPDAADDVADAARDVASHASDHGAHDLGSLSLRSPPMPPAAEIADDRKTRKRNGGWAAGLALAAAAMLGVIGIALHESEHAAAPPSEARSAKGEATTAPVAPPPTAQVVASASAAPTIAMIEAPKPTAADTHVAPSKAAAPPSPTMASKPAPTGAPNVAIAPTATAATTSTASPTPTATAYVPDKPESMDIRSAVNLRQSAANACVAGLVGESHVTITFGPTGSVTAVVVTDGPAKGTGAEACIKRAFSTARIDASKSGGTGYAVVSDVR